MTHMTTYNCITTDTSTRLSGVSAC